MHLRLDGVLQTAFAMCTGSTTRSNQSSENLNPVHISRDPLPRHRGFTHMPQLQYLEPARLACRP